MPNVQLPEPGRPHVLLEPAGEQRIADVDSSLIIELHKAHGALLFRGFGAGVPEFGAFTGAFCPTHVANQSTGRMPIDPEHNIRSVDPAVVEAATGLGMTDRQRLLWVELPLAFPIVLAGVRIAVVVGIGLATIAAAIGAGGLGVLIYRGVATVDHRLILAGAVPAAVLALLADFLLGRLEKRRSRAA